MYDDWMKNMPIITSSQENNKSALKSYNKRINILEEEIKAIISRHNRRAKRYSKRS